VREIAVTRYLTVSAGIEHAFDVLSAEDVLPSLLHRFGPIPAVVGTTELTGPWVTPGASRTVVLADGGSAHEELTDYERPRYFAYRVTELPAPLGVLVRSARGRWWLDSAAGHTQIRWTYSFEPATRAAAPVLWPVVHVLWRGYMRGAMRALEAILSQ
jgi:hypothetical protein